MKILDSKDIISFDEERKLNMHYYYRLTSTKLNNKQAFGIEVERQDFSEGVIKNIERESIPVISEAREEVCNIVELLAANIVAPIHVIDIIGEKVDELAYQFGKSIETLNYQYS